MANKLNLKSTQVLEKKFKTEISGYSAREVDEYLDLILEDYRAYEEMVDLKNNKLEDRLAAIESQKERIIALELELKNTNELLSQAKASKNIDVAAQLKEMQKKIEELKKG